MAEQEVLLEVRDLCKNFKVRSRKIGESAQLLHALSHVNLKVYRGETLGVIGESGCGKSTLGRCIVGLHTPSSGQLVFEGKPLNFKAGGGQGKALRRKIQMIFQDPYSSLDPRKTCGKIVEEPMIIHKTVTDSVQRQERVQELMSVVEMCIRDRFGLTYVFISHDLSVIKHISDRIAIMYLGQVVELCGAEGIYDNPLHPYTRALLSAVPPSSPFEEKKTIELKGDIPSPIGDQVGCPLASRCPHCTDRCRQECPSLKEQEPGHQVACFLYES